MEKTFGQGDSKIARYAEEVFKPADAVLTEIQERSLQSGLPEIQVGPMDGLHLEVLARAMNAKKIVEIGTLGGYSGVCLARALPEGGQLFTFEMSPRNAEVARESFRKAGVENKVQVFVGPALDNLDKIKSQGPFDLVFIDADKNNYPNYLKWAAENLRTGGSVLGDNTFAWGLIANAEFENPDDQRSIPALQKFNLEAAQSGRFRATVLPTGEGLTLAVKIR